MFENPRRGRQVRNFTTNAPKILDLKSSSEQIFSRQLPLGAPVLTLKFDNVTVKTIYSLHPVCWSEYGLPNKKIGFQINGQLMTGVKCVLTTCNNQLKHICLSLLHLVHIND